MVRPLLPNYSEDFSLPDHPLNVEPTLSQKPSIQSDQTQPDSSSLATVLGGQQRQEFSRKRPGFNPWSTLLYTLKCLYYQLRLLVYSAIMLSACVGEFGNNFRPPLRETRFWFKPSSPTFFAENSRLQGVSLSTL